MKTSVPPQPADITTGPSHSKKGPDITGLGIICGPQMVWFTCEHVPELQGSVWSCSEHRTAVRTQAVAAC